MWSTEEEGVGEGGTLLGQLAELSPPQLLWPSYGLICKAIRVLILRVS